MRWAEVLAAGQPGQTLGEPPFARSFARPLPTFSAPSHPPSRLHQRTSHPSPDFLLAVSFPLHPRPVPPSTESSTSLNQSPTLEMNNPW